MKLPNSYGSVSKLSGKRRNPWRVVVTVGWEEAENGRMRQIRRSVGYYRTKQEALQALADYHQNPGAVRNDITFAEMYEKWSEVHFPGKSPSVVRTIRSAYNHSKPLHDMRFQDIRAIHMETVIKSCEMSSSVKGRMKSLYNLMYKYAIKADIVQTDYAALVDTVKREAPQIPRVPFSDAEIEALKASTLKYADMVLIGIYTGLRPQELATLTIDNIDTENWLIIAGMKTDAGRDRVTPIHPQIRSHITALLASGNQYLWPEANTYDRYAKRFKKLMQELNMDHRPHDTRHTFVTRAKEAGINEWILKRIIGHVIRDLTEGTYTHRTYEQFHEEILKIK